MNPAIKQNSATVLSTLAVRLSKKLISLVMPEIETRAGRKQNWK